MIGFECCGGIFKGSTPSLYFNTNADLDIAIEKLYVSFYQCGQPIIEKTKDEVELITDGVNQIKLTLTQEDSLKFSSKYEVQVQLRIKYEGGSTVTSGIGTFYMKEVLKHEVI